MSGYFFFLLALFFYLGLALFKPASGHNDIISGLFLFVFYGVGLISSLMVSCLFIFQKFEVPRHQLCNSKTPRVLRC